MAGGGRGQEPFRAPEANGWAAEGGREGDRVVILGGFSGHKL